MRNSLRFIPVMCILSCLLCLDVHAQTTLAFPGAEGFGRFTTGGRGGTVYEVTTLSDSGPGSLRAGIDQSGARTIVFRVSGQINLNSELRIRNGNLTIAGQTAPGGGITVAGYPVLIDADNIIIRFMRFRLGDQNAVEADALSARFNEDLIIDHCTFSWSVDETMSMYRNQNTTFQWNFVTESLNRSVHSKDDHGYGGIWGGDMASFHHNLIAHHKSRNPRFNGARYEANWNEHVDFRNNVIYNWGDNSIYGAEPSEVDGSVPKYNMVANYFKFGPATGNKSRIISPDDQGEYGYGLFFIEDNFVFGSPAISADNWDGGVQGITEEIEAEIRVDEPFSYHLETDHTAQEAFEYVLRSGGAVYPYRDAVDERIVMEVATGTATYGGVYGAGDGIIDTPDDVGGYPELPSGTAPDDSDSDGMPDDWETENGLDPNDASDRNADADEDGFTNLEEYLNELVEETNPQNIAYLTQPSGLVLTVDRDIQNSARISWNPLESDADIIVERGLDLDGDRVPEEFEEVGTVTDDTTFHEYLTLEEPSRVYYRIKAVSQDSESFYSSIVDAYVAPSVVTGTKNELLDFAVYPNPVIENHFTVSSNQLIAQIVVTDLSGRVIRVNDKLAKQYTIQTAGWKSGYYLVKVSFEDGQIQSSKIIKR